MPQWTNALQLGTLSSVLSQVKKASFLRDLHNFNFQCIADDANSLIYSLLACYITNSTFP